MHELLYHLFPILVFQYVVMDDVQVFVKEVKCCMYDFKSMSDTCVIVSFSACYNTTVNFSTQTDMLVKKSTSRQRSGKGAIRKRLPLQKPRSVLVLKICYVQRH